MDDNGPFHPSLHAAAALLEDEKHPVGTATGLCKALRELSSLREPPRDLTAWLAHRLRDYRPPDAATDHYERVLVPGMAVKCDEFANIHVLPSPRIHPQVWNFRKCDLELPVFGVGQCHLGGISFLAKHFLELGYTSVKWCNMREEPVVFLDGQACAPRLAGKLNENLEYLCGIEGHELDAMEARLAKDCVERASEREDQSLGVYYQCGNGDNEERFLSLASLQSETTCSVLNAYEYLDSSHKGDDAFPSVRYCRIPIADETAPEEKDFDQLIAELKHGGLGQEDSKIAWVFNCQMGRGRTTTGMVSACILFRAAAETKEAAFVPKSRRPSVMQQCQAMNTKLLHHALEEERPRNKTRGEYQSILSLLDLIDCSCNCTGRAAKALADQCIDACAHAQNLVECIAACQTSANAAEPGAARSPEFWHGRALHYLERYAYLVLFAAYALEHAPTNYRENFTHWIRRYWHFQRVLSHLTLE